MSGEIVKKSGAPMHPAFAKCNDLMTRKSQDYGEMDLARADYFPFGHQSYVHMLHTKTKRLVSLTKQDGSPNFESVQDTVEDLINYAAFYWAWLEQQGGEK